MLVRLASVEPKTEGRRTLMGINTPGFLRNCEEGVYGNAVEMFAKTYGISEQESAGLINGSIPWIEDDGAVVYSDECLNWSEAQLEQERERQLQVVLRRQKHRKAQLEEQRR